MRPSVIARLALAGTGADRVRVGMTAFGSAAAALAWLCAATVASLGVAFRGAASDSHYRTALISEPGLRPGVIATFILLTIPVLALVAQSARLGAPNRDRRIAAIRMAGATPRQAVAVGAGESGVSAALGAVLGMGVFFLLRALLNHPDRFGRLSLPTDVLPPTWAVILIVIALPALVALLSGWLLRRVITTPLGVVRRVARHRGPRPWPGLLIAVGIAVFAGFEPLVRLLARHHVQMAGPTTISLFYIGLLCITGGVALGAGWLAYTSGQLLRRYARRPATQIAGARLVADPWQGSRAMSVVIIGALFGGATAAFYASTAADLHAQDVRERLDAIARHEPYYPTDNSFYTNAYELVGIAIGVAIVIAALGLLASLTDSIVSRRRTNAALVATGVPRSVLARTVAWQTFAVAVPAVVMATVIGALIPGLLLRTAIDAPNSPFVIPWGLLGLVAGGSLAAIALTVSIGLLFLKASSSPEELRTT